MISKRGRRVCVLTSFVLLVKLKVVIEKCRKKGKKAGQCCALSKYFLLLPGWLGTHRGCHGNQHKLWKENG